MAQPLAIAEKSLLMFCKCCSSVSQCSLALFIGILLLSESVAATPTRFSPLFKGGWGGSPSLAQQPATSSPNATTTDRQQAYARGRQLIEQARQLESQGTAEQRQQALAKYEEALSIWQQLAVNEAPPYVARGWEASTLRGIGTIYYIQNEPQKALDSFDRGLAVSRELKNRLQDAIARISTDNAGSNSDDQQKLLDSYKQALVTTNIGEASLLDSLGNVYYSLGKMQEALKYHNQALSLFQAEKQPSREAITLNNIGDVYFKLGETQSSLGFYNRALVIQRAEKDTAAQVQTLQNIGLSYINLGKSQQALESYEQALKIQQERKDLAGQADILSQIGLLNQKLDAVEKRRIELFNGQWTDKQVQALEKETAALLEEYRQVQEQIRRTSPRYATLTQPQPLTLAEIQKQVLDDDTILLEYSLGEERSYLWAVTKTSITSYELPKRGDIEALAQSFYQNTGKQKAPEQRGLGAVPREDSLEVTTKLSQILLSPVAGQLAGKRLLIVSDGALQFLPFAALPEPDTIGKDKNPVPLIVKHEIVNLPSASTLAVLRQELNGRQTAPKMVAVLADPVFSANDERLKTSVGAKASVPLQPANPNDLNSRALTRSALEVDISFQRLPFTRTEAQRILELIPTAKEMSAFDFAANRATATNSQLSQYQVVHFATHGIFNSKNPELSGVVFSLVDEKGTPQNGFLRLQDIFNLNLPAELVVLSACETGLGKEVKGEGLVGLTRGFMYASAPRVLVSLWSVSDRGTSELMSRFYKKMLQEKLEPAAALRAAQIEMLQDEQWKSPYYWAAFTLQGEWR